ncbi:hypothetical protein BB560_003657 [Smittium megazygosporum]|uniref:Peptidase S26 domain-containing protein n=1 Tax=Smittium megazygosporum TaxID=133381 RepID=A0A2T9ZBC4_9FUNG|nr:hypothetical protein BB560_003657 [Smittium megazygosporum]
MLPTINPTGSFVLSFPCKSILCTESLKPGMLISYVSPIDPSVLAMKRIIAMEDDIVLINPLEASRHPDYPNKYIKVPKGHVWVSGDNTASSIDSKDHGPVPIALIRGQIEFQIWPSFFRFFKE